MTLPSRAIPRLILCLGVAELIAFAAAASLMTSLPAPSSAAELARGERQPMNNGGAGRISTGTVPVQPRTVGQGTQTNQTERSEAACLSGAPVPPNTALPPGTIHVSASMRRLLDAIRKVESGGNDRAIGDGGRSVGPYQCGLAAWLDGGGKRADYPRLAYDRAATERVMLGYWTRYGCTTDEQRARCWNGGPMGMRKRSTREYWNKVKAALAAK